MDIFEVFDLDLVTEMNATLTMEEATDLEMVLSSGVLEGGIINDQEVAGAMNIARTAFSAGRIYERQLDGSDEVTLNLSHEAVSGLINWLSSRGV